MGSTKRTILSTRTQNRPKNEAPHVAKLEDRLDLVGVGVSVGWLALGF